METNRITPAYNDGIVASKLQTIHQWLAAIFRFNSLWPSDAIWRQRSGSTLAQIMPCCLAAPRHYLNQYWLIISGVHWNSSEGNFTIDTLSNPLVTKISLKMINFLFVTNHPGANEIIRSILPFRDRNIPDKIAQYDGCRSPCVVRISTQ